MLDCIFTGDVMPGSQRINQKPDIEISKDFGQSHLVLGNLESSIVISHPSMFNLHKIPLWSTSQNIDVIKKFNFTHLCLNNNHTFDLFEKGLDETIEILNESNIKGFGLSYDRISQFVTIDQNAIRLGVFAVNWIQTQFTIHLFKELKEINIASLKDNLDFLVCFIHWGDDHNVFVNREQQETAKQLIDRGVDLVIGHHPHVPQGYERYKGKYIFYSLGNFIFTAKESYGYIPYKTRYDDHRENILFQRLECKIGLYIRVIFRKESYEVVEVKPVYREHTLPIPLPKPLFSFYEDLKRRMNYQVAKSQYE